jgi:hypothetical protein
MVPPVQLPELLTILAVTALTAVVTIGIPVLAVYLVLRRPKQP